MRAKVPASASWIIEGPPRAVLVAYDASGRARGDLQRAIGLCGRTRAALTVVVARNPLLTLAASWVPAVGTIPTVPGGTAACDEECRRSVLGAVPDHVGVRFVVAERTCSGALLERLARRHGCDTVVCAPRMGRRLRRAGLRVLDAPAPGAPIDDLGPCAPGPPQVDAT